MVIRQCNLNAPVARSYRSMNHPMFISTVSYTHLDVYKRQAQLGRAERAARELVAADPSDPYAVLLLGRVLCRQARGDEGKGWLRRAEALGLTV